MGSLFIFIRHVGVPVKCSLSVRPCSNDRTQTGSVMRSMLRMMMDHVKVKVNFIFPQVGSSCGHHCTYIDLYYTTLKEKHKAFKRNK